MLELTKLEEFEKKRIYHYSDGSKFEIENVTHFLNSNSTHRLQTEDGRLWIIEKKFIVVELLLEKFTL
jgi:hypothetical protein